jgi:hypothetical protein
MGGTSPQRLKRHGADEAHYRALPQRVQQRPAQAIRQLASVEFEK